MAEIKVLIKPPNRSPYTALVEDSLKTYQELVGGYIETIGYRGDVIIVVNEEGKLKKLLPNFIYNGDTIVGTAVFVRIKGDSFTGLTDRDMAEIRRQFE